MVACFVKPKPEGARPISEAAEQNKEKVQKSLKMLQEKLVIFEKVRTNCQQAAEHIRVQNQNSEKQIKKVFSKLQKFLKEEEKASLAALKAEEQLKSKVMREKIYGLNREIPTLLQTIRAIEKELKAKNTAFLERVQFTVQDPQLVTGALIDEVKHVGNLSFRVWDKMKSYVSYTPVIMDPNTAHLEYTLSDDLTSVRCGKKQKLPDNPERFDHYGNILSSESYKSGLHSWDVEVGENSTWDVGVLAESFQRKGDKVGQLWCIGLIEGEYGAYSSPGDQQRSIISVNQRPLKIRVQLDCNRGKLAFSDPDANTHLYTFVHNFTDPVIPYIYSGDNLPVKILPKRFSVVEQDDEHLQHNEMFPLQGRRCPSLSHDSFSRQSRIYDYIGEAYDSQAVSPAPEFWGLNPDSLDLGETVRSGSKQGSVGSGSKQETIRSGSKQESIGPGSKQETIGPGSKKDIISPGSKKDMISPGSKKDMIVPRSKKDMIVPRSKRETIGPGSKQESYYSHQDPHP